MKNEIKTRPATLADLFVGNILRIGLGCRFSVDVPDEFTGTIVALVDQMDTQNWVCVDEKGREIYFHSIRLLTSEVVS